MGSEMCIRDSLDAVDIAPPLLAAAGTRFPATVGGVRQLPVAGRSFESTFDDPRASAVRTTQYFELRGNRAITSGRWRAVALHECGKPYEADRWQLFDLAADPAEARDVAAAHPATVAQLKLLWAQEWQRSTARPLEQPPARICAIAQQYDAPAVR